MIREAVERYLTERDHNWLTGDELQRELDELDSLINSAYDRRERLQNTRAVRDRHHRNQTSILDHEKEQAA